MASMETLSSLPPLKKFDGSAIKNDQLSDIFKGKRVALYFAAGWCPMCTRFEPSLMKFMAMEKIACDANERIWPVNEDYLKLEVHSAVVVDALTDAMFKDISVASEVSKVLIGRRAEIGQILLDQRSGETAGFYKHKIDGIIYTMKQAIRDIATNTQQYGADKSLMINILETVKLDIMNGNDDNARVGIALAANVGFEPSYENQQMEYPLGKDWVDAYISWNLAFVTSINTSPAKLLIPSVACAATKDDGRDFIHRRTYSLGLHFLRLFLLNDVAEGNFLDVVEPEVVSNIMEVYAKLASVDRDDITKAEGKANLDMLYFLILHKIQSKGCFMSFVETSAMVLINGKAAGHSSQTILTTMITLCIWL